MELQKPKYLSKGDKVAIISPSGAINPNFIDEAANTLQSWGLIPIIGKYAKTKYGRFAGTDENRIEDLQWALDSNEFKAIICGRGGYGAVRILDKLNFEKVKLNPKWLIGFSDITALHSALTANGIQSVHATMAKALAHSENNKEATNSLKDFLFGKSDNVEINMQQHNLNRIGETSGKIVGGNLSVLYGLRATPFDLNTDKSILFIEDLAERPYHIDRMMQNLRLSGVLGRISGLLVGRFSDIEEDVTFGQTVDEIIRSATDGYDYPIAYNFPIGHEKYNLAIRHGANINLTVTNKGANLKFL